MRTALTLVLLLAAGAALAQAPIDLHQPGLIKDGRGTGLDTRTNFAPGMGPVFLDHPAILRSQISEAGGMHKGGSQCAATNYVNADGGAFDWWDTYCEERFSSKPRTSMCAAKVAHQGLDMVGGTRATCLANAADDRAGGLGAVDNVTVHAAADGEISRIGSFSLNLVTRFGTFKYLHLNMRKLAVKVGDVVRKGEVIGFMSRDFGRHMTTYHLHLELWKTIDGRNTPVPLYFTYALAQAAHERRDIRIVESGEIVQVAASSGDPSPGPGPEPTPEPAPANPILAMISSYWSSGELELGLVAAGADRLFVRADPDAPNLYIDAAIEPNDLGSTFYRAEVHLTDRGCGAASVPFSGPVVDDGLGIALSGFVPAYTAECEVSEWLPLNIKLKYVRKNEAHDAASVDVAAVRR